MTVSDGSGHPEGGTGPDASADEWLTIPPPDDDDPWAAEEAAMEAYREDGGQ